jgi:hypothetical protein
MSPLSMPAIVPGPLMLNLIVLSALGCIRSSLSRTSTVTYEKEHGERALIWAAFVLIGNLVALIAYLLTRTPRLYRPIPLNTSEK